MRTTFEKVILGGIFGGVIGGFITGFATLLLLILFKPSSGAVIDYSWIVAVFAGIWGALCGVIVGGLLMREIESVMVGLGLALCGCLLLFSFQSSNDTINPAASIVVLFVVTGISSFIVSFLVHRFINNEDEL